MEICWENESKYVKLHWSLPRSFEEYADERHKVEDAFFYTISCPWNDAEEKLLYLGKTYAQDVWVRMNQYGIKKCQEKY